MCTLLHVCVHAKHSTLQASSRIVHVSVYDKCQTLKAGSKVNGIKGPKEPRCAFTSEQDQLL